MLRSVLGSCIGESSLRGMTKLKLANIRDRKSDKFSRNHSCGFSRSQPDMMTLRSEDVEIIYIENIYIVIVYVKHKEIAY